MQSVERRELTESQDEQREGSSKRCARERVCSSRQAFKLMCRASGCTVLLLCEEISTNAVCGCVGGVSKLAPAARKISTGYCRRRELCPSGGRTVPHLCSGEGSSGAQGARAGACTRCTRCTRLHTMPLPKKVSLSPFSFARVFSCAGVFFVCRRGREV